MYEITLRLSNRTPLEYSFTSFQNKKIFKKLFFILKHNQSEFKTTLSSTTSSQCALCCFLVIILFFILVFIDQVVSKNGCLNFCRYKNKQKSIFNIISLLVEPRNESKN